MHASGLPKENQNPLSKSEERCVAVLYRAENLPDLEPFNPRNRLKEYTIGIIHPTDSWQIPWGEKNEFYGGYGQQKSVCNVVNPLLYAYLDNPGRITILPESEFLIDDTQENFKVDSSNRFFGTQLQLEKYQRRLCIKFGISQKTLKELLSSINPIFEGHPSVNENNLVKAANDLKKNIISATFDLFGNESKKWIPYKTLTIPTPLEETEEWVSDADCVCRIF